MRGQRVIIGYKKIAIMLVLHLYKIAQSAEIVT